MMKPGTSEAVREVSPINSRSPLMAVTAVQALCKSTKTKLPAARIKERIQGRDPVWPVAGSHFEL